MSRTPIDLTGQRFGRLVALCDVGSKRSFRLWEFICDCGQVVQKTTADVRFGGSRSCGCLQRELTSSRRSVDITGQTFGRLTALRRAGTSRHGFVEWDCRCECGAMARVSGCSLRKGATRSCGCLHREIARNIGDRCRQEDPISRTKAYRSALRAKIRQQPEKMVAERLARMFSHALAGIGSAKNSRTFDSLGYSPSELRQHIEKQFLPGMSWENRGKWEVDHIVPLSLAKTVEDVFALNQLPNLRPLWSEMNREKRARRMFLL